ncbi:gamma-glutamyltransferase [Thioalkalivibrio sp. XN279]|uniref:gamma-glutamyltransferase n=1 Tax=Thioalkalivibrio sp. XN279 TaxID=2714953 RepID=UPI00140B567C|nr:gamma-glutamyltransferase [Thioalkalivibrio sp. XN279]NHA15682.1 gamma-glutamyltransferase [Thioalkalivibrio sp. XN279]
MSRALGRRCLHAWLALALLTCVSSVAAEPAPPPGQAAIASAHPLATRAGLEVLKAGGNAFDAAVAVSAALGVVEPFSSGLGGGGFWLLHFAADGRQVVVDARETAPGAAHAAMYLDAEGEPVKGLSLNGPLAAGIPGTPAALVHISERYGRLPFEQALAPAIRQAREGFPLYRRMHLGLTFKAEQLRRWPGVEAYLPEGKVPEPGTLIRLPGLAEVMERLAAEGAAGFYQGEIAARMVEAVRAHGGIWSLEDLQGYRVVEREPLVAEYPGGLRLVVPPPPSAGGVAMIQAFNMLQSGPAQELAEVDRKHLVIEVLRRAFRDRAWLGDPDFVDMPLQTLLHPAYADGLRATLRLDRATPSATFAPLHSEDGGEHTTHFSIIDAEGNRVAVTQTINGWFGSSFAVPGLDLLLNNEMDDFAVKPGAPNLYQLVGAGANNIQPGKRMLSSMTPTFIESPRGVAVLGTPGGSRIISMVLLASLAWVDGADAAGMVALPRYHHQYLPDRVLYEEGALSAAELVELERRGHVLQQSRRLYGNMNVVTWDLGERRMQAATDPRAEVETWTY